MSKDVEVALVLSGGAARGLSHIGIYKALCEFNITPKFIAGTSAGAIVGALIAKGYSAEEISHIAQKTDIISLKTFNPSHLGLFKPKSIKNNLTKYLGNIKFEDLSIPLVISTTDIKRGVPVYIKQGPLIPALMASSAMPLIYKPVVLDNLLMVDGGVSDNFPITVIDKDKYKIVGCNVNPLAHLENDLGYKDLVERCVLMAINKDVINKKELCQVFIEPPELAHYGLFQISKAEEIIQIGYQYTLSLKEQFIKSLMIKPS